jgi:hypothetical protein
MLKRPISTVTKFLFYGAAVVVQNPRQLAHLTTKT